MTVKQLVDAFMAAWAMAQSGNLWGAALAALAIAKDLSSIFITSDAGGDIKLSTNLKAMTGSPEFAAAIGQSEPTLKAQIDGALAGAAPESAVTPEIAQKIFTLLLALAKKWFGF